MFYLFMKQEGEGCDYTIGCGRQLAQLEAETLEDAIAMAVETYAIDDTGEQELEEAVIFGAPVHTFDLPAMKHAQRVAKREQAKSESDDRERAEFERLRKKFNE